MHSETWKEFERFAAWFIGGRRYPANTGGRIDGESDIALVQAKKVRNLSHVLLTSLADEMAALGKEKGKIGVVIHQVPKSRGRGKQGIPLITMTCEHFDEWFCLRKENVKNLSVKDIQPLQEEFNRMMNERLKKITQTMGLESIKESPDGGVIAKE